MSEKVNVSKSEKQAPKTISIDEAVSVMAFGGCDCDCEQEEDINELQLDPTIEPQKQKGTAAYALRSIDAENEELKKSADKWISWLADAEWPPAIAIDNKVVFNIVDGKQVHFSPWFLERLFNLQDEYEDTDLDVDGLFSDVLWALYYEGGVEKMKQVIAEYEEEAIKHKKPRIDNGTGYEVVA